MEDWQEKYLKELKAMDNEKLLEEYSILVCGDDYEGCYTTKGMFYWDEVHKEFRSRLKDIGFLK